MGCSWYTQIRLIFKDGIEVEKVDSGECIFIPDKTPFYAESGGQVGDQGSFTFSGGHGSVQDCIKQGKIFLHRIKVQEGVIKKNDKLELSVDASFTNIYYYYYIMSFIRIKY